MIRRGGSKQSMTFSFRVAPPVVAQDPLVLAPAAKAPGPYFSYATEKSRGTRFKVLVVTGYVGRAKLGTWR